MYHKNLHIHFLGIGGIGMSGIAKILKYQGYRVSGCDLDLAQTTVQNLINIGCPVSKGHNGLLCQSDDIDVLVHSSAINQNNPELQRARERGIPIIPRAVMLAELMRTKHGIAIAGAHGKTTTTSMVSQILIEAGKSPTVIIGGLLKSISTNAQLGGGDFLVAEADESDKSLLHLQATIAVITNIDLEHLETYKDIDEIKAVFRQFMDNLPFYGKAIVCIDCPRIRSMFPITQIKTIKYGVDHIPQTGGELVADLYATEIELTASQSTFKVWQKQSCLGEITINMPGKHNVLNSLAAIAVGLDLAIPFDVICNALSNFKGIERRFSYHGTFKGAEVFDDYGHHPTEIEQTIKVARKRANGKLHVVFQPHRFTRTHKLWQEFVNLFCDYPVDQLIITDIYPASEQPIPNVNSAALVEAIRQKRPDLMVQYVPMEPEFDQIIQKINQNIADSDLLLLLGAGRVNQIAKKLI